MKIVILEEPEVEVPLCTHCHVNAPAPGKELCTECGCIRCGREVRAPGKTRGEKCLAYARKWQKAKTRDRLKHYECITCGDPAEGSRCERCAANKSAAYFANKEAKEAVVA